MPHAYTNRLARERSPYLLQHAHNPVDWWPWCDEAFETARADGKIVFLSVGYSTCHWCHVMERETFEDPDAAAVINTLTVPVKVDREERPDVDQVYMGICHALTGSGGWPLTVLLTPDRLPFFAGTYFPRETRGGRIGFPELLRRAAALWRDDPERLRRSAREIVDRLSALTEPPRGSLSPRLLAEAEAAFGADFDAARGGFGGAPKFPTPHNLVFLLRQHGRTGNPEPRAMAEATLDAMVRGGLWDHVGFGFHRYATDIAWQVPHFEKMLYDQAGLALAYLEAYRATGEPAYGETARRVLEYVLRDLAAPEGAFYSAEDADSEGVEGKFYVWTRGEVLAALGPGEGERWCRVYGLTEEGNYAEEATRERTGANIPRLDRPLATWAGEFGLPPEELAARLEASRERLFARRNERVRPHRDDKVLAAWNGLMASALARGAVALEEPAYAEAAARALTFLLGPLSPGGRLHRRYRQGEVAVTAFAEDYAAAARGCLDVYEATFDPGWLRRARDLAEELWDRFGGDGALFDTAADAEALVLRPREVADGATPSANSLALEVFARLGLLTGEPPWTDRARGLADALAGRVATHPAAFTQFLEGAALLLEPTAEVVIAGAPEAPDTRALVAAARRPYAPGTALLLAPPGDAELAALAPFTRAMAPAAGKATAYLCRNATCEAPLTDPDALARSLGRHP